MYPPNAEVLWIELATLALAPEGPTVRVNDGPAAKAKAATVKNLRRCRPIRMRPPSSGVSPPRLAAGRRSCRKRAGSVSPVGVLSDVLFVLGDIPSGRQRAAIHWVRRFEKLPPAWARRVRALGPFGTAGVFFGTNDNVVSQDRISCPAKSQARIGGTTALFHLVGIDSAEEMGRRS